ncbi:hypothetical protein PanWU01x14_073320 [Parasponia andersonii]|uniref:Uncharacterized protein n=1 Tax=Parasponia andersonii TaxID=3476 RepID=A0A2P5DE04_PARAD|nr:hypothetical protein PanWU01x14_073320 [Parasponia andersonii]
MGHLGPIILCLDIGAGRAGGGLGRDGVLKEGKEWCMEGIRF